MRKASGNANSPSRNIEDMSVDEVLEQFDVTREQIQAVLDFVARSLQPPVPPQKAKPADAHSF